MIASRRRGADVPKTLVMSAVITKYQNIRFHCELQLKYFVYFFSTPSKKVRAGVFTEAADAQRRDRGVNNVSFFREFV